MDTLPPELLMDILHWCLLDRTCSIQVLSVCRAWHDFGLSLLHRNLEFRSQSQLQLFLQQCPSLRTPPRSISISLAGASIRPQTQIFRTIGAVWQKSQSESLQQVDLCLNSHSLDPCPSLIGEAMMSIDPTAFRWSGPDPPHHWSTAIVPIAAEQLCRGLSRWARLRSLHLSHIAFPADHYEDVFVAALVHHPHPVLRYISLSQAVFLSAAVVADITTNLKALQRFHLVDCYVDSIWGARLRLGDVERAVQREQDLSRVRAIVICEARLERIQGGDRGS
ncbi:hypothetical protein CALVIDRAFT_495535 [Calocera viscosa TUFC12733]|uniref:F-box domain-containing protein n=1 Tax=Calocera viscosa (strain TUFC12733) TaxID=1330018 RepID=A0A167PZ90_CALVF|nr:hypothetical protein CALVIDRAFT_495535 [Calocera viscosa TUFC12733]